MRLALSLACVLVALVGSPGQQVEQPKYVGSDLLPIVETFDSARLSGSLVFSGRCPVGYTPDLPEFLPPGTNGISPLQRLRQLLPEGSPLQVIREPNGLIRIGDPNVPDDILSVKIKHIAFDGSGTFWRGGVYRPSDAVGVIVRSPEVLAFAGAQRIDSMLFSGAGGVPGNMTGQWPAGQPRISGSLENVTVGEALDYVLRTFPGLWVYENCPGSNDTRRKIWLGFFGVGHWGLQPYVKQ
jgi:hypothetical protein